MEKTVIIVDDNRKIIEAVSDLLVKHSFKVLGTGINGQEAVNLYKSLNPDYVVMDIEMPKYDGLYGIDEILKVDFDAKIIVMSTDEKYEQQTIGKAARFLVKPNQIISLPKILNSI
ncbi:Chemotaxis response regulator protein-glutamate methylesterase 1 [Marine Group I thaumarchaeote SCGC AAA799-E16]|uniref:Chemotaxis response regulator protein-glutamate methylesterase 1 n=5 Tax=Marine Group I TaxID=905826 RepID=A0A087S7W8_9ARCH|nr:Chemotaxis response regulator protein-glutamate methylesterase 1 [Marine Group I thaumarchaeote SCGC AAA799-N04]KER05817.1 Chemotaxis response regulator protein-glutamate methylesterase 1 [Marine Group I thaumarchaeote SCGC AAA799-E16]KFM17008.1 Chemotaxis response regulator protein-glutamate methylesterase 1 [Marine Group I thaumarchaeote SCGC AAA799-D11]KFM19109.1 Chemotaxis response regulator protein-glutamate methylesterase 2 [Marine Group I thaumarchaeote SCGC RSA3]KFM21822.1 Chemotaxis